MFPLDTSFVSDILERMERVVRVSPFGHLPLGWRLRLWKSMHNQLDNASLRRDALTYFVVRDACSVWGEDAISHHCPAHFRDECIRIPDKGVQLLAQCVADAGRNADNRDQIASNSRRLQQLFDHISPYFRNSVVGYAALAVIASAWSVMGLDDKMYEDAGWYAHVWDDTIIEGISERTMLSERDNCDCHFWSSEVAAYGSSEGATEDAEARREFWLQWIMQKVPQVLESIDSIQASVAKDVESRPWGRQRRPQLRL